jgi:hypothetical protein
MHEFFHLRRLSSIDNGVSEPALIDVSVYDVDTRYPHLDKVGRCYGPQRSKWLARHHFFGTTFAIQNVDNYVGFAMARFMENYFSAELDGNPVDLPKFNWQSGPRKRAEWDSIWDDAGDQEDKVDFFVLDGNENLESDWDFYGGGYCSSDVDCENLCPTLSYGYCTRDDDRDQVLDPKCHCGNLPPTVFLAQAKLSGGAWLNSTLGWNATVI